MEYCKYCNKECKNKLSLVAHENVCMQNPNRLDRSGKNNPNYGKKHKCNHNFRCRNGDIIDKTNFEINEYKKQNTVCEICGRHENIILCVDHNHKTKKFRGLLCQSCNRSLGWYENNKENIEKYLAPWENS